MVALHFWVKFLLFNSVSYVHAGAFFYWICSISPFKVIKIQPLDNDRPIFTYACNVEIISSRENFTHSRSLFIEIVWIGYYEACRFLWHYFFVPSAMHALYSITSERICHFVFISAKGQQEKKIAFFILYPHVYTSSYWRVTIPFVLQWRISNFLF